MTFGRERAAGVGLPRQLTPRASFAGLKKRLDAETSATAVAWEEQAGPARAQAEEARWAAGTRERRRGMTDLQLYILVAIPLVGILSNTALFVHLSTRLDGRLNSMQADMKDLNKTMTALEIDVAMLNDRAGIK